MKKYFNVDFEKQREALLKSEAAKPFINEVIEKADAAIDKEYEALKWSEYMLVFDTGDRATYESKYFLRRNNCSFLSMALWFTKDEKYLKSLIDHIFMICDEYTWCLPAHIYDIYLTPERTVNHIDLFQSETARLMCEIVAANEDFLPDYVIKRIKMELERRVISSIMDDERSFPWEKNKENWSAVCIAGVCATVLHFGTDEQKEKMVKKACKVLDVNLSGFENDGCCTEGVSYWCYGFGNFLFAANMLKDYTKGEIDYFKHDKVKKVSKFLQNTRLGKNKTISFADGFSNYSFAVGMVSLLKAQYPDDIILPELCYGSATAGLSSIKEFLWFKTDYKEESFLPEFTFFEDAHWYIKNTDSFSFAAKAGHNDELHNHNDVGSFMVVVGDNIPLTDLGAGLYTRQYFSRERYEILNNSSRGHSVPIINGKYQIEGKEYCAENVIADENKFSFDMEKAYESGLVDKLTRSFEVLDDGIILEDKFTYSDKTESIIERMVSNEKPIISENFVDFGSAKVYFDEGKYAVKITYEAYKVKNNVEMIAYFVDFTAKKIGEESFKFKIVFR